MVDTRELLRSRVNPLTPEQVQRLGGVRPAGPPPRPAVEPIQVQRRVSSTGVVMVAGQMVALGRLHRHRSVTVTVSDTTLGIDLDDGDVKVVRSTTTRPVRSIEGQRRFRLARRTNRANSYQIIAITGHRAARPPLRFRASVQCEDPVAEAVRLDQAAGDLDALTFQQPGRAGRLA
jgi:hypothetical protein